MLDAGMWEAPPWHAVSLGDGGSAATFRGVLRPPTLRRGIGRPPILIRKKISRKDAKAQKETNCRLFDSKGFRKLTD
jgi:hypothetical protein